MNKHIIRHTDIQNFLKCRNYWDFGSALREGYKPYVAPKELDVGGAWAKAMEAYYDPQTWGSDHAKARALSAFIADCDRQREAIYQNSDTIRSIVDEEIAERIALGKGMLRHFFGWSVINDVHLIPKAVELDFEVAIRDPQGRSIEWCNACYGIVPGPHTSKTHYHADGLSQPIVYQGTIDRLFWDKKNQRYWLGEDKTAGAFHDSDWLVIDPQTSRYMWALKEGKGIDCVGMIWTQAKKDFPQPPNINKDGTVSVDSRQCTTALMFAEAVLRQHGPEPDERGGEDRVPLRPKKTEAYQAFHDYLTARERRDATGEEPWLIRRVYQPVSPEISNQMGWQLYTLAKEMLNDPEIYPTANSMNCTRCVFKEPCIIRHEGHDWRWALRHHFNHYTELEQV